MGVADDGGGEDVAVLLVVGHDGLEPVDGVLRDSGAVERGGHRCGEAPCLLVGGAAVGDEVAHHLVEDALAPIGVVELGLGDAQQVSRSGRGYRTLASRTAANGIALGAWQARSARRGCGPAAQR